MNITLPTKEFACCVQGGPQSGKTAAAIARAQQLVNEGCAPANILFICGIPAAAFRMQAALPKGVAVCSIEEVGLPILQATQQRCRLLEPYEQQVLFEDMRSTGLPQKPLRRIMQYLLRSIAQLKDWDENWIEMREERLVYNTLMDNLAFTGGVCAEEVPNLAARQLFGQNSLQAVFGKKHVVVDDYGLLSCAGQVLCGLLAQTSLFVTGEAGCTLAKSNEYAYPAGLDEFVRFYPNARVEQLPEAGSGPKEACVAFSSVQDEFAALVQLAQEKCVEGTSLAIVGAHAAWRKNLFAALQKQGVPTVVPPARLRVRAFDDEETCQALAAAAQEKLIENPSDGPALRTLFGLGNYLANSAELLHLRKEHPGQTLAQLHAAAPLPQIQHALASYALQHTHQAQPSVEGSTQAGAGSANGPAQAFQHTGASAENGANLSAGSVYLCAPEDLWGQHFSTVVFGGFLQGWIPPLAYFGAVGARKEQLAAQAQAMLAYARRAAKSELQFTYFEECPLEFAESYGLHYGRIRLKEGVRTCQLLPFEY